ncbi:MAG: alpha/beta hydrolase [Proteobacteria bacterium]|nr:alpha/beta hydrolase [Pseudomonadota bacterium]
MRRDIKFKSEGLQCAGWLYVPDDLAKGKKRPAIVMAHGFSATKEMYLQNFAEVFCRAGFVVMVFDYRFLGASEGEPRGQVIPYQQHQDYRNAITWAQQQPEVDSGKIGVWGSSYSGGHVLHLAAFDKRIKAVVSQVPAVDCYANAQRLMRPDHFEGFRDALLADRAQRFAGGPVNYADVVAPQGSPSVLPTPDSFEWFIKTHETMAPTWINKVTLESLEYFLEYRPITSIELISPTPLLMIVAEGDVLVPADLAIAAFAKAREPKVLELLSGGHFDAYLAGKGFEEASGKAANWFKKHLLA